MKTSIATALLALVGTSATALAGGEGWYADFDAAAAAAKEQGKDLFVDFTGSDWCGWCIRLDNEVFSHEEFLVPAKEKYVLVALDFPRGEEAKAKVPNPKRNEELSEKYSIGGFPTILVMTPEGEVYAQTGYQQGGPEKYIAHLTEITTAGKKAMSEVKVAVDAFEAATGEAKVAAWESMLGILEGLDDESPFAARLGEAIRWALTFDADNAKGLKSRAVGALLGKGMYDDDLYAAALQLDPQNESALYEKAVGARFDNVFNDETARAALGALDTLAPLGIRDTELSFSLHFRAALWTNGPLESPEEAKRYAQAALKIGSEDEDYIKMLDEIVAS